MRPDKLVVAVVVLLSAVLCFSPVLAIEMEDLMEDVLDSVRQESRQTMKNNARMEAHEVVVEEVTAPQVINASGLYQSKFSPAFIFTLTLIQSGSSLTGSGSDDVGGTYTFSGSINGNLVSFSINGMGDCVAKVTGSGGISGKNNNLRFNGSLSGTDCIAAPITEKFDLLKK